MAKKQSNAAPVMGILSLVYGALAMCINGFNLVPLLVQDANAPNPLVQFFENYAQYMQFMKVIASVGIALSTLLILAGIGLLMVKPWGRAMALVYGFSQIVLALVIIGGNYILLVQPILAKANAGPEQTGAAIGGAVGTLISGCGGVIFPVILIIVLSLRNVRNEFRPEIAYEEGEFSDEIR